MQEIISGILKDKHLLNQLMKKAKYSLLRYSIGELQKKSKIFNL